MKYDLVQYGCDVCGELTDVLDVDQSLPKGWVVVSRLSHLCPTCAKHIKETNFYPENYRDIDRIINDLKKPKGE
jgi:hypothetical protein